MRPQCESSRTLYLLKINFHIIPATTSLSPTSTNFRICQPKLTIVARLLLQDDARGDTLLAQKLIV